MIELKQYRTDHGIKTVLVNDKGRKYLHVLMMDGQLTVRKVDKTEERFMRDVIESKQRRSLQPAVAAFASYGARNGATKEAKRFLREARS